jgi:hypothetical protein
VSWPPPPPGQPEERNIILTNERGSDEIMIQDPTCGDISYADVMLVTDFSECDEQLLEESP